jgi:L-ascorbate metabolism protein UlaG (beta-lactamase superfamily)
METGDIRLTLVGGPTLLVEVGGFRLLTDPTFDVPGAYQSGPITLTKLAGPAVPLEAIGPVDAVLLSHDQHADNLDPRGRAFLASEAAGRVLTTRSAAARLGGRAEGLAPWERRELAPAAGSAPRRPLVVTATPARHGPPGIEPLAGEVTGFVVSFADAADGVDDILYASGDTVWYGGVAEVAQRFQPRLAVLFTGAAKTRGAFHLTMASNDALEAAHAFAGSTITSIHNHGWAHFTETEDQLAQSFQVLGAAGRLLRLPRGEMVSVPLRESRSA